MRILKNLRTDVEYALKIYMLKLQNYSFIEGRQNRFSIWLLRYKAEQLRFMSKCMMTFVLEHGRPLRRMDIG